VSWPLLAIVGVLWLGGVLYLRAYRIWLLYYALAVGGGAALTAYAAHQLASLDTLLAASTAWSVHQVSELVGLPTRTFPSAPGTLLVLVVDQSVGWTALQIGVESSGLLELSALAHILLWYPGWDLALRARVLAIGLVLTWAANALRVLVIIAVLHGFGKGALVVAHTYLGKMIFFAAVVGIMWWLVTSVTLSRLQAQPAGR
jgi:exosortase/archaeosortase family protein